MPKGASYEGQWHNGNMHGTGSCKYPATESEYTGQWVDNKRQGEGCMKFGDSGAVYEGAYCEGQMHGQVGGRGQGGVCSNPLTAECTPHPPPSQGTYTWKDGSYYCGEFSHDKQHGAGTYYHAKVRALAPPCPGPLSVALSWPCFKRASALPLPSLCPPSAKVRKLEAQKRFEGTWEHGLMHGEGHYFFLDPKVLLCILLLVGRQQALAGSVRGG